jgi:hypothetical protein
MSDHLQLPDPFYVGGQRDLGTLCDDRQRPLRAGHLVMGGQVAQAPW